MVVESPPWTVFNSFGSEAKGSGRNKFINYYNLHKLNHHGVDYDDMSLLASLDGLVCVAMNHNGDLGLWNPLTNIHKKLPKPKPKGFNGYRDAIGLYKDDSVDLDYKILHVNSLRGYNIYSRRLDSWRNNFQLQDRRIISTCHKWSPGTFFRESLYFTVKDKCLIISFDVKAEIFREIQYPHDPPVPGYGNLVVVKGWLHLCVGDTNKIDMLRIVIDDDKCEWIKVVSYSGKHQQMPFRWSLRYLDKNGKFVVTWEHTKKKKSADSDDEGEFTQDELCLYSGKLQGVFYVESRVAESQFQNEEKRSLFTHHIKFALR
ncbi:putative F-box protein At4g21240 [Rutidosis leptorrhynchoides]|uniref:putative F-box protein At4g21240 n=1 Tax=Rutidosis leptorrhynchoides TaxID=125765 RepID=UPI003A99B435